MFESYNVRAYLWSACGRDHGGDILWIMNILAFKATDLLKVLLDEMLDRLDEAKLTF